MVMYVLHAGMDFEKFYGEIGREFIEVHHLERIADTDGEHEIDPKTDMVPLCSNCHSMIHRKKVENLSHSMN